LKHNHHAVFIGDVTEQSTPVHLMKATLRSSDQAPQAKTPAPVCC